MGGKLAVPAHETEADQAAQALMARQETIRVQIAIRVPPGSPVIDSSWNAQKLDIRATEPCKVGSAAPSWACGVPAK
jgi:hypothetical protein